MKKIVLVIMFISVISLALLGTGCKFDASSIASSVLDKTDNNSSETSADERPEEEVGAVEEAEEKETENIEEENKKGIKPSVKLIIYEGPEYSKDDDICYYRIEAIVEGYPEPTIEFSRDDSGGAFGNNIAQINLYSSTELYTLTVRVENQSGFAEDSIELTWGCEEVEIEAAYNNDFELGDVNGNIVSLSDFQGNMIVLNFWATWCGPCRVEIPDFIEVYNEYKNKDVVLVGVSLDSDINDLKQFIDEYNINYPILFDNKNVNDIWKVEAIPTTFILDRNGNELAKRVGSMTKQDLINLIESNK